MGEAEGESAVFQNIKAKEHLIGVGIQLGCDDLRGILLRKRSSNRIVHLFNFWCLTGSDDIFKLRVICLVLKNTPFSINSDDIFLAGD